MTNNNSCILFFNTCAEKRDMAVGQTSNVFYYHDRIINADKVVHVVFRDATEMQIAQSLKDAETSIPLIGAAVAGIDLHKADLYKDVSRDRLFGWLDFADYLILGICDGEAWCFWPTQKQTCIGFIDELVAKPCELGQADVSSPVADGLVVPPLPDFVTTPDEKRLAQ